MSNDSHAESLVFARPGKVEIRPTSVQSPQHGEVRVHTRYSLISPGTERLIYRGSVPIGRPVDETLVAFRGSRFGYPMRYGYACLGTVNDIGAGVDRAWQGRDVIAWWPHESVFCAPLGCVEAIPTLDPDVSTLDFLFLPLLETAVTLVQDAGPILGDRVAIVGLGIVGQLVADLLARMAPGQLVLADRSPSRLARADRRLASIGIPRVLVQAGEDGEATLPSESEPGADVTLELSGSAEGINHALALTRDHGRVILGSWYGESLSPVRFDARFHRSRIQLKSSQVSTIDPTLQGRWTTARRRELAEEYATRLRPSDLITHTIPFREADRAYRLLDDPDEDALGILLKYATPD